MAYQYDDSSPLNLFRDQLLELANSMSGALDDETRDRQIIAERAERTIRALVDQMSEPEDVDPISKDMKRVAGAIWSKYVNLIGDESRCLMVKSVASTIANEVWPGGFAAGKDARQHARNRADWYRLATGTPTLSTDEEDLSSE